jgi:hypothetical protein
VNYVDPIPSGAWNAAVGMAVAVGLVSYWSDRR